MRRRQRFILANDSTTIAVQVPIWLTEKDIAAIEARYAIELLPQPTNDAPSDAGRSITGHIDFLQIRNAAIHILDYKRDASTGKPCSSLSMRSPSRT